MDSSYFEQRTHPCIAANSFMVVQRCCPIVWIWSHSGFLRVCRFSRAQTVLIVDKVDTDILKPDTGYLQVIERPTHTASTSSKGSGRRTPSTGSSIEETPYTEPVSEGEDDDDMEGTPAHDEGKRIGLDSAEASAAVEYRKKMLQEQEELEVNPVNDQEREKRGAKQGFFEEAPGVVDQSIGTFLGI